MRQKPVSFATCLPAGGTLQGNPGIEAISRMDALILLLLQEKHLDGCGEGAGFHPDEIHP